MPATNKRVLLGMSGGVDSSVTAHLLKQQGFDVVGVTMKVWPQDCISRAEDKCCGPSAIADARGVAHKLGVPHYVVDEADQFERLVIDYFSSEYRAGRTPNPCVMCNTHIKWRALLKRADALDCEFIATGHYAFIHRRQNGRFFLSKGVDDQKDQSYVLWGLEQDLLSRTILPLGKYKKPEIRQMAVDYGYPELAKKSESYEICFVPDNDYRGFLKKKMPDLESNVEGGSFVDMNGNIIGKHRGYPFYTIGQRKGLDITFGKPVYVTAIHPENNTVVLGEEKDLAGQSMMVTGLNMQKYNVAPDGMEVITKIRYKDKGSLSNIYSEGNQVRVHFYEPVKSITPGQSAVFYEGDDVVGGGIIRLKPEV